MKHQINASTRSLELTIPGDVLSTSADQFRTEILALLETESVKSSRWTTLVLDLTAAKMVDSVGLNLLVSLYKEAQKRTAKCSALIKSPNIQRTFAFTRLDAHIEVVMVT
jgi:anti-anti-sigma factor